jgi:hypothetical protein
MIHVHLLLFFYFDGFGPIMSSGTIHSTNSSAVRYQLAAAASLWAILGTLGNLACLVVSNMRVESSYQHETAVQQVMHSIFIGGKGGSRNFHWRQRRQPCHLQAALTVAG